MNNETSQDYKLFGYCRKSTEDEKRQIASIRDQVEAISKMVETESLNLVCNPFTETKSAKEPGRPILNEMLDRIEDGEGDGILCWDIDRLYRNPVDEGRVRWMLQRGIIKVIKTPYRSFYPDDAGLLMGVEGGRATDYVIKLSKNVKRGMLGKATRGWLPNKAPLGYKNYKHTVAGIEHRKIKPAKDFEVYRKMFDLMLTGKYTPPQIQKIVNEEWNFKTVNGKKLGRSMIYRILTSPFYCGEFEYPSGSNNWHKGKHQKMITVDEHEKIMSFLGKRPSTREQNRSFAYRGPIKCGECGAMITAQITIKRQKNGVVRVYIYYHCTGRKDENCSQKHINTRFEDIDKQVSDLVESIEIPKEFHTYAMKWMEKQNAKEANNRNFIRQQQQKEYDDCVELLDGLTKMRARKEIDLDDFQRQQKQLKEEKRLLWKQLQETDQRVDKWLKVADDMFLFLENLRLKLLEGDKKTKTAILSSIGTSFVLKDKKLTVDLLPVLSPMQVASKEIKAIHKRLKPQKTLVTQEDFEEMYSNSSKLLPNRDSNPNLWCQKPTSYH